jgi:ArsR family transcriptional regulator
VRLTALYQCLAHPDRLRLVALLAEHELCVQELQAVLQLSQVEVSKHLAYLREYGFVSATKAATRRIYQCRRDLPFELAAQVRCLRECIKHANLLQEEFARARALPQNTGRKRRAPVKSVQPARQPQINVTEAPSLSRLEDHLL